jgi:hypothetical protein
VLSPSEGIIFELKASKIWPPMEKIDPKKTAEQTYLTEFLESIKLHPIKVLSGEAPDFFVHINSDWLAIEVTNFQSRQEDQRSVSKRQLESEWEALSKSITEEREKSGRCKNIHAFLAFHQIPLPNKSQRERFIGELLEYLEGKQDLLESLMRPYYDFDRFPILKKYLRHIGINKCGVFVDWGSSITAGSVGLSEADLTSTLKTKLLTSRPSFDDLKNRIVSFGSPSRLASRISENWLLIYTTHHISQTIGQIDTQLLNSFSAMNGKLIKGPFDKLFIFDRMWKQGCFWADGSWQLNKLLQRQFPG